jgi:hypothetical protein
MAEWGLMPLANVRPGDNTRYTVGQVSNNGESFLGRTYAAAGSSYTPNQLIANLRRCGWCPEQGYRQTQTDTNSADGLLPIMMDTERWYSYQFAHSLTGQRDENYICSRNPGAAVPTRLQGSSSFRDRAPQLVDVAVSPNGRFRAIVMTEVFSGITYGAKVQIWTWLDQSLKSVSDFIMTPQLKSTTRIRKGSIILTDEGFGSAWYVNGGTELNGYWAEWRVTRNYGVNWEPTNQGSSYTRWHTFVGNTLYSGLVGIATTIYKWGRSSGGETIDLKVVNTTDKDPAQELPNKAYQSVQGIGPENQRLFFLSYTEGGLSQVSLFQLGFNEEFPPSTVARYSMLCVSANGNAIACRFGNQILSNLGRGFLFRGQPYSGSMARAAETPLQRSLCHCNRCLQQYVKPEIPATAPANAPKALEQQHLLDVVQ